MTWRPQYHVWVCHGKEGVYKEKSVVEDVNEDAVNHVDGYETNEENVDEDVDHLDEITSGKNLIDCGFFSHYSLWSTNNRS